MRSLRQRLPPLNALVAFEASARHLSFTLAAQELGVSREAVSRQIRILEADLGQKLFLRRHRALDLTGAGEALHADVRNSLGRLAEAAERLRGRRRPAQVTVAATVALASFWLTPRLPRFRAAHPDVELRVVVSDRPVDLAREGIDVALRYGDGRWPGLVTRRLFGVESFPVCAPGYLADSPTIEAPADLLRHTLLNLDGSVHALEDWRWWLQACGLPVPESHRVVGFDNYANVIQAAMEGQGIALGFSGILDGLLERGDLVRPLETQRGKGLSVYLAVPSGQDLTPAQRAFHDWVLAEAHLAEPATCGPAPAVPLRRPRQS